MIILGHIITKIKQTWSDKDSNSEEKALLKSLTIRLKKLDPKVREIRFPLAALLLGIGAAVDAEGVLERAAMA